ncbi:heavy-metal-associated domain-containing protein [Odoribacter lunatus]|uniref:heavy-metal-associated domain-containing protein n=1 Tax=Odoribacter lunatus TaxID=2941335 RepID=UPI00203F18AE|nr:heavy-metal-associated domain-containing protein [Odoribacter lunatus]
MKAINFMLALVIVMATYAGVYAEKKDTKPKNKTVVYKATLHCESCKARVEKNIPYEKGVKDLKVDMQAQTVSVTFREDKNTQEGIQKAIEKLKIPVSGIVEQEKKEEKK